MTQKTIKIFINEFYSKPPKNNYPTNETDVYHIDDIDDIWSLDTLDLKDYGRENSRSYEEILVVIDSKVISNFSKIARTVWLKKNAQKI